MIQPKCWRDKLNVRLSFYELSVFTDDIFSVFYSSTKSNASANVVAAKQQHRSLQCDCLMIWKRLIQCPKCTQSKIQQENKPTSKCVYEIYFIRLWTLRQKATRAGKYIVARARTNNNTDAKYNWVEPIIDYNYNCAYNVFSLLNWTQKNFTHRNCWFHCQIEHVYQISTLAWNLNQNNLRIEPTSYLVLCFLGMVLTAVMPFLAKTSRHQGDYLQRKGGEKNGTPKKSQRLDDLTISTYSNWHNTIMIISTNYTIKPKEANPSRLH